VYICPTLPLVCHQAHAIIRHHEINMQEKETSNEFHYTLHYNKKILLFLDRKIMGKNVYDNLPLIWTCVIHTLQHVILLFIIVKSNCKK
jgi:hypothetical protein